METATKGSDAEKYYTPKEIEELKKLGEGLNAINAMWVDFLLGAPYPRDVYNTLDAHSGFQTMPKSLWKFAILRLHANHIHLFAGNVVKSEGAREWRWIKERFSRTRSRGYSFLETARLPHCPAWYMSWAISEIKDEEARLAIIHRLMRKDVASVAEEV